MSGLGAGLGLAAVVALAAAACSKPPSGDVDAGSPAVVTAPSTTAPGAPRAGMVWIPAGVLRAGSAPDEAPRVADAEMPLVDVPMAGFYIDVLPWPDEVGAIATTNVSRDEAARLCGSKGKRLCSELEWERACKGPDNQRFDYGATYDGRLCGAGVEADSAARRPTGEKPGCKSGFGVRDMHGGAWEWTDSRWGRGQTSGTVAVRGGNDVAGEVATRCAFGRPLSPGERSPSVGFRCCAGPRNDDEVHLEVKTGAAFEKTPHPAERSPAIDALGGAACGPPTSPAPCFVSRAWTWRPAPNVELSMAGGCIGRDPDARCGLAVSRTLADKLDVLAQIDTGREIPEVVQVVGPEHHVRVRGANVRGPFFREVTFQYGRVEVRDVR